MTSDNLSSWWRISTPALLTLLSSSKKGLSHSAAVRIQRAAGPNILKSKGRVQIVTSLLFNQVKSPISALLVVAALLSAIIGDSTEGLIILGILVISAALGFLQELRAHNAVTALLAKLEHKTSVLRDGTWSVLASSELVPGDILKLSAGSQVPADSRVLESKDLFVDQAPLTGESFPAEKDETESLVDTDMSEQKDSLYFGTHVISGCATALVVRIGPNTVFGQMAEKLAVAPPSTEFELGIRRFGYLLLEVALALSLVALAVNISYQRPPLEALLFTLALVVGMTPQLLPVIVTSTLATGAHRLAHNKALVRRLSSVADIGGITVLCTDKTGTLTEGVVTVASSVGIDGENNSKTLLYGYLNSNFETGYKNALDDALRAAVVTNSEEYSKVDEVPYDFTRKRLSVLVRRGDVGLIITKGAFNEVFAICSYAEPRVGLRVSIGTRSSEIKAQFELLSSQGYRLLAVAYREHTLLGPLTHSDEQDMVFLGFLAFSDPPKPSALASLRSLEAHGIQCKLVTGDNRFVSRKVALDIGVFSDTTILTGSEVDKLSEEALRLRVTEVDVFAEVDPNQKERIIRAFKRSRVGVAYLGDGINDAAALRAADVGISVDSAVDATKEAADIVLLTKDLAVLLDVVREGRRAFANTLKYILITTSASFGNMFSVVGAAFFADFLPLLPKQILLLNVFSDLPSMAIASDRVDSDLVEQPLRWSMPIITYSMLVYGAISSVFDYLTFGSLLLMGASTDVFRTCWFIESVLSTLLVLLVIRTHRSLWRSPVGVLLVAACLCVALLTLAMPFLRVSGLLGFTTFGASYWGIIAGILVAYVTASELAKQFLLGNQRH